MNKKQEKLKNLNFPDILYKYRDWSDDFHKFILTQRQVFLASPSSFKDKLDCKIPIRYDLLTDKDIFNKCIHDLKIVNPRLNRSQCRSQAQKLAKKSPLKNPETIKNFQEEFFSSFSERCGILSLTADSENDYMWKKYSDNFKGFCVGFNTKIMFNYLGGGCNVNYFDILPIIYPEPKHSLKEQFVYQVYSKERKWKLEKEYRTHIFSKKPLNNEDRNVTIPAKAYNFIILGKNMPDEIKKDLKSSIAKELSHIEIIEN